MQDQGPLVSSRNQYDAIVVGGGHNGLVAGAYLARAGLRTVVLEARDDIGGAARTEEPWGPEFKVTALSYVMSLMPPTILRDLDLARHGYRVLPMGPSYIAFPDGRSLLLEDEPSRNVEEVSKFSKHDAANLADYEAWIAGLADVLGPLLLKTPPKLGSRRPRDLFEMLRLAWGMRGLDVRTTAEATRLMTTSIRDLLDRWFESPELKGVLAVNGIIGTWAGPDEPGTAYVMAHHSIGDVGDGHLGSWGYPVGGMGAVSEAIRRAAVGFGCEVRTGAAVDQISVANGKVRGVVLRNGEELHAATVVAATHPQITFLRQIDRSQLPSDFVRDLEAWRSRSGVVKVNVALSELPDFIADPGTELHPRHTGAVELCHSIEYLERAFQDAREGRAAARPFSDGVIPSTLDPTIAPEGMHVMSLFTQWVAAHVGRRAAHRRARGVRRSRRRRVHGARAELQAVDRAPAGDRALRDGARVRAARRQHLPRRAVGRPAVPPASRARLRRLHDAGRRALPVLVGDPRRRRRDRHPGVALHAAHPQ